VNVTLKSSSPVEAFRVFYLEAGLPGGGGQLRKIFSSWFPDLWSSETGNFFGFPGKDVGVGVGIGPTLMPLLVRQESMMLRRLMASTLSFFKIRGFSDFPSSSTTSDLLTSWTELFRSAGCGGADVGGGEALPCDSDDRPLETAESLSESLSDFMCDDDDVDVTDKRFGILGGSSC